MSDYVEKLEHVVNADDPEVGDTAIQNYTINFGPQHPAAHGVLRLVMELDGEIVERCDPHVGLLHRGTEKLIEFKTYLQALPYFDRLDYCSPLAMEHSYVLAIEKLLNLEVPIRAQYLRVFFAELTRICNHMLNLGSHVMDVGAMTPNLWLFEIREDCLISSSGRAARACTQPVPPRRRASGRALEAPHRHSRLARHAPAAPVRGCDQPRRRQPDLQAAQCRHRRGQQGRRAQMGLFGPNAARLGYSVGPAQVAAYDVYDRMEFDVPVGTQFDCYDRFMVRVEEVRQSAKIMKQCLQQMPEGRSPPTTARSRRPSAAR